jgi:glutamate synthase domain-containing protein 1
MCGILGYFRKTPGSDDQLGATMLSMLEALGRRGPDSAGVALVGPVHRASYIVRIQAGDELDLSQQAIAENREAIETFARTLDNVSDVSSSGVYVRFLLAGDIDLAALTDRIESLGEGIRVLSVGHAMELSKEVGSPRLLEGKHHISAFAGTHGIGHTRLCTESIVDLSHSQPFWGRGAADVAIVHNGHITTTISCGANMSSVVWASSRKTIPKCWRFISQRLLTGALRCARGWTEYSEIWTGPSPVSP